MQDTQQGTQFAPQFAQQNLDAAVNMSMQATRFWRRCAALQAQGANEMFEEGLRISRTIIKTQSEMIEAAEEMLSESQRAVLENIEESARRGEEAVREAGGNGSHALRQSEKSRQQSGSHGQRRAT